MATANDIKSAYQEAILTLFGARTHLQPLECTALLGLKTARPINRAITSGELPAYLFLPECPRLRFVAIDDLLSWLDAHAPIPPTRPAAAGAVVREKRALARAGREGRASAKREEHRSVS